MNFENNSLTYYSSVVKIGQLLLNSQNFLSEWLQLQSTLRLNLSTWTLKVMSYPIKVYIFALLHKRSVNMCIVFCNNYEATPFICLICPKCIDT